MISDILHSLIVSISSANDFLIITNFMNEMSLDLIAEGAMPKDHNTILKTEKDNVLGGYILLPTNSNLPSKPIIKYTEGIKLSFVRTKNSIPSAIKDNENPSPLKALTNSLNEFVTSDLDILMICSKNDLQKKPMDYSFNMGDILKYEYDLSMLINKKFTDILRKNRLYLSCPIIKLISHGPFNRYSKSKLEDIGFPLTIYHPTKGKSLFGSEIQRTKSIREFFNLCNIFQDEGYIMELHNNWLV